MRSICFQRFIIALILLYPHIATAGWMDDMRSIKETVTNVLESSQKAVKDGIKKSINVIDPSVEDNKLETEERSLTSDPYKKMATSNNGVSVSGHIRQVSVGYTRSDQKNNIKVVQVYLMNAESSSDLHINCLTYIFGGFTSDPIKKRHEYKEFRLERVKLTNVKSTDISGQCTFSQLVYLGADNYAPNSVEGWVKKASLQTYHSHNQFNRIHRAPYLELKEMVFTGNSLIGCKHLYASRPATEEEKINFLRNLIGSKVRLSNVRYGDREGACLFDAYNVIEQKSHHASAPSKITQNAPISKSFGNVEATYMGKSQYGYGFKPNDRTHPFYSAWRTKCQGRTLNPSNSKASINADIKKQTSVTLINVTLKNERCYFDKVIPNIQKTPIKTLEKRATDAGLVIDFINGDFNGHSYKRDGYIWLQSYNSSDQDVVKTCGRPWGRFRPNPNSQDNGLNSLLMRQNSGVVTMLNVTVHENGECYFDKIVPLIVSLVEQKSKPTNTNASSTQAEKSSAEPSFKPDNSKRFKGEGNMLIGTVTLPVSVIPMQSTTMTGRIKSEFTVKFNLDDVVNPASNPYNCNSYILSATGRKVDMEKLAYSIRKHIRAKARVYLTQVRPADETGSCLFEKYTIVNKYDSSAHITQADVFITSAEQEKEKEEEYKSCISTLKLNRHFRCDCYAEKFLQVRKLFPNKPSGSISAGLQNECVNVAAFTSYEYKRCLKKARNIRNPPNGGSVKDFCNCVANKLESLVVEHGLGNIDRKRRLSRTARSQCK